VRYIILALLLLFYGGCCGCCGVDVVCGGGGGVNSMTADKSVSMGETKNNQPWDNHIRELFRT
jgi:hypothetical protein